MKLRLHHQEMRFRLSPRDIEHLLRYETLQDRLQLSHETSWSYELHLDASVMNQITLHQDGSVMRVHLPNLNFRKWLQSAEIEWVIHQAHPELSIIIEKDLKPNRS